MEKYAKIGKNEEALSMQKLWFFNETNHVFTLKMCQGSKPVEPQSAQRFLIDDAGNIHDPDTLPEVTGFFLSQASQLDIRLTNQDEILRATFPPKQVRENISYAVGDPYSIFDHIPHTVNSDGSVTLDQNAIEAMWRATHNWEPLEGWHGSQARQASDPGPALSPLALPRHAQRKHQAPRRFLAARLLKLLTSLNLEDEHMDGISTYGLTAELATLIKRANITEAMLAAWEQERQDEIIDWKPAEGSQTQQPEEE